MEATGLMSEERALRDSGVELSASRDAPCSDAPWLHYLRILAERAQRAAITQGQARFRLHVLVDYPEGDGERAYRVRLQADIASGAERVEYLEPDAFLAVRGAFDILIARMAPRAYLPGGANGSHLGGNGGNGARPAAAQTPADAQTDAQTDAPRAVPRVPSAASFPAPAAAAAGR